MSQTQDSSSPALASRPFRQTLAAFWQREIRGKRVRVWGSWAILPLYFYLVQQPMSAAGVTVLALGSLLRVWASGLLHKESTLCTEGPYAVSRNPLYVGSILVAVSLPLGQDQYLLTAAVAAGFVALFVAIVRREEAVLSEKFGAAYDSFRKRVPMFFGPRSFLNLPGALRNNSFNVPRFVINRGWEPVLIAVAIYAVTYGVAYWKA